MKYLKPIPIRAKYFEYVRQEIERVLDELIYKPLAAALKTPTKELLNQVDDALYRAIVNGRVWYEAGEFKGTFNAAITRSINKIGGRYNPKSKTFSLRELPPDLAMAQGLAEARYDQLRQSVLQTLDQMDIESIDRLSNIQDKYRTTIDWLNDDFVQTVKKVSIPPVLTEQQRGILASEWGTNLNLYVKKWSTENILKLREDVQRNAFAGRRASSMVEMIRHNYGVSRRKAEFLARQETSLLMSKFKERRYRDVGITRYRWSGAMDERERPDHKLLQGKIFSFDQPPITDLKTGARNNPGEDYNCRCVAIPVIDGQIGSD